MFRLGLRIWVVVGFVHGAWGTMACGDSEVIQEVESVDVSDPGASAGDENSNGSTSESNDNRNENGNDSQSNTNGGSNDNASNSNGNASNGGMNTEFRESNGYVVMETESAELTQSLEWDMQADLDGFTGAGYFQFQGNGICNGPANSPLTYSFTIVTGGRYELRLRAAKISHCVSWKTPEEHAMDMSTSGCIHEEGTCTSVAFPTDDVCPDPTTQCRRSDISNDAFVQIRDSSDDYVAFLDQPANSVGDGIKLFGGQNNRWAWTGKNALDTNGSKCVANLEVSTVYYTLVVEGRSQLFRIDRIILFDVDQTSGTNGALELPETR